MEGLAGIAKASRGLGNLVRVLSLVGLIKTSTVAYVPTNLVNEDGKLTRKK